MPRASPETTTTPAPASCLARWDAAFTPYGDARREPTTAATGRFHTASLLPARASAVPAATAAALAALQGGVGDGRAVGAGPDAHTDPELSCIRCHTYVGHWVR